MINIDWHITLQSVANARFFGGDLSMVPKMALTVGVATGTTKNFVTTAIHEWVVSLK